MTKKCTYCGSDLADGATICGKCGMLVTTHHNPAANASSAGPQPANTAQPQASPNNPQTATPKPAKPEKNKTAIIIACVFGGLMVLSWVAIMAFSVFVAMSAKNIMEEVIEEANESIWGSDVTAGSSVKGQYSREIFSGRSFHYYNTYDSAVFTFNDDSTFTVEYMDGYNYKGTYAVYNGFYITTSGATMIEDTSTFRNVDTLVENIEKVATKMMDDYSDILNTYLLWLVTDDGIEQPFVVNYNLGSTPGVAVNILGTSQGNFIWQEYDK